MYDVKITGKNPLPKGFVCLILILFLLVTQITFAESQRYQTSFQNGVNFFRQSRMLDAAAEFRSAQEMASNNYYFTQALYWVILAQLALGDYSSALNDMDVLEARAPNSEYAREMKFHRGRAYYNLGFFEDALIFFQNYVNSMPENPETADRIAAAYFWMGECLFAMKHYDEAEKFYSWVVTRFPRSPRVEVSTYRIDLIKHRRVEQELLSLLHWSHEEHLRTSEEYQRRLRIYEHTLNVYQMRIAELTRAASSNPVEPVMFP